MYDQNLTYDTRCSWVRHFLFVVVAPLKFEAGLNSLILPHLYVFAIKVQKRKPLVNYSSWPFPPHFPSLSSNHYVGSKGRNLAEPIQSLTSSLFLSGVDIYHSTFLFKPSGPLSPHSFTRFIDLTHTQKGLPRQNPDPKSYFKNVYTLNIFGHFKCYLL